MSGVDVLARAGIALTIILGALALYRLYNRATMLHTRSLAVSLLPADPDTSLLVYFTTPTCIPCKTVQRPAIELVKASLGERLKVVEIDASKQPDVASRWGVLSVPTTFVVAPGGQVRYINHGVARAERLIAQLQPPS